ncbi:MAG TPA: excisionase family DNA-binding protein, partial [Gammaproteobacteria bacterium]|nr:excisionase family DNA-binding protein [Gammaproteobacteria bacterium]
MKEHLSPKEMAEAIGVSESTVKRWVDDGRLQAVKTSGGHRRIPRAAALHFARTEGFPVLRADLLAFPQPGGGQGVPPGLEPEEGFHRALLNSREEEAAGILTGQYLDGRPLTQLLDSVLAPAMRRIGDLWRESEEGIFIEHRAVDICERILDRFRELSPPLPETAPA